MPEAAGLHGVRRAGEEDARRSRPRASRSTTDAQLKAQCKQQYEQLRDQVLQLLISFEWIEGEAEEQGVKVTDAEVKKPFERAEEAVASRRKPTTRSSSRTRARPRRTSCSASSSTLLSNKIRDKVTKGKDKVTDAADPGLLRQEQGSASPSPSGATCASS